MAVSDHTMANSSVAIRMKIDVLDDFAFNAYQFLQHDINPLIVYCRLRDRGVEKGSAMSISKKYERFVYPFARGMSHLIQDMFDNNGYYKDRIIKEMYKS